MPRNLRRRKRKNKVVNDINYKKVSKLLSVIVLFLFILLVIIAIFYSLKNNIKYKQFAEKYKQDIENQVTQTNDDTDEEKLNTDTTFTMTAIGDVMCHNTQYQDAYKTETDTYDFSYVFENISLYTKTADIAIGNLETTFAGKERGYSSYPTFNTPDELAYNLKDIGIDVLSTAANHALDKGFSGLSRTIDVLNDADIAHVGTYQTQEAHDTILFKYVKGIKIAFLSYTYGTNGIPIPAEQPFCVNLIDRDLIKSQIATAKEGGAEIIVSCMHWGTEYQTTPNQTQKDLADFLFQNGVDIILGNHPHVLQPMEKRTVTLEDGTTKDGFVIYALGNFIADQKADNTRDSIILNLTITKHIEDGKITIDKAEYVPIYMYKDTSLKTKKMKLLDINKIIYNYENYLDMSISSTLYELVKKHYNNITNIVGNEIN